MKRILSIILTLAMLVSPISNILVFAENVSDSGNIAIENGYSFPGGTVDVEIAVSNNPGIYSLLMSFEYDSSVMTLTKVSNGKAMTGATFMPPKNMASGCSASWYYIDEPDAYTDGNVVVLTFDVLEAAVAGKSYAVSVKSVSAEDKNKNSLDLSVKNGKISIIDYLPGDVDGDEQITLRNDVSGLNKYILDGCKYDPLGYAIQINEDAGDVDDDDRLSLWDVIAINKYFVDGCQYDPDGYAVKLLPHTPRCKHTSLTKISATEPNCNEAGNIEYWVCECSKYFDDENATNEITLEDTVVPPKHTPGEDATCTEAQICVYCGELISEAKGHVEEVVPGFAPDYGKEGLTDGVKCSVCGETIVEQKVLEALVPDTVSVKYEIAGTDTYLKTVIAEMEENGEIIHSNPEIIDTTNSGYTFLNIPSATIPGYTFLGWYDGYSDNAVQIKSVEKNQTGSIELYAKWSKNVYTVTFDSPDVDVKYTWYDEAKGVNVELTNSAKYTVDTGLPFKIPEWFGYTFVGWSDENGFIIDGIKPGMTGNIEVHANWTSNRNKAVSYSHYDAPIIIEDDKNGRFLFVYNIGRIENIPLNVVENLGNTQSLDYTKTYTVSTSVDETTTKKIANTVAEATTRSSSMTLSHEWEDIYGADESVDVDTIKTKERTDSEGNVVGGNYFVSNSEGGSSYMSTESGGSSYNSAKVTTENSTGINASLDLGSEMYCDTTLGVSNTTKVSAGVEVPAGVAKVKAGVENSTTVSAEVSSGRKDTANFHVDGSKSSYIGTNTENTTSAYYNATASSSSTWNSQSGYESSYETSRDTEVSEAISEAIKKSNKYSVTNALGGSELNTETVGGTDTRTEEYSTTISISQTETETKESTITLKSDRPGYYRVVSAGTLHVYGVVGYDVATNSYFTYTFNVMDDEIKAFLDYSKESSLFDDCENALVPFEIPYEVNEYVVGLTGKTEGLVYGLNDNVTAFEPSGELFSGSVVVPQYYSVDNGDGTFDAYKTKSFDSETFRGNTEITTVVLPVYVTEIPDYAFEGCTNLKSVIAFGVTSIGDYAFSGCENLEKFSMDKLVTHIGEGAFEGTPEIAVMARNADVANAAINSGAKRITVDLTSLEGFYENQKIIIDDSKEYFGFIGGGNEFSNVSIKSDAKETFISNATFVNNEDTPFDFSSETVTLARVSVIDAPGYAMISRNEDAEVKLLGSVELGTTGEKAVLSKNVTFSKSNTSVAGELNVDGTYLVCGTLTNDKMLNATNVETINEETFELYLSSIIVTFDANGGEAINDKLTVYYNETYGELPTPERTHYVFDGWYTESEGGDLIDSETLVEALVPQTLYAHWTPGTANVYFDANEGTVDTTEITVTYLETFGTLPKADRDFYDFDGWYTTEGIKVTPETIVETTDDIYLSARWILHEGSGWVLASEVPEGAEILDTKYTYTLTSYTTSSSNSMPGWTLYDTTFAYSDYGAWSAWSTTQYYNSEFRQVESAPRSRWVDTSYWQHQYHYYHFCCSSGEGYLYTYKKSSSYTPHEVWVNYELPYYKNSGGINWYKGDYCSAGHSPYWFIADGASNWTYRPYERDIYIEQGYTEEWTEWRYRDRYKIYTYHFTKNDNMESITDPSGANVSNVQKWVQYRAK